MTLLSDEPQARPAVDEPQLLFPEAKQRRKHRWVLAGVVAIVLVVVALTVTLGFTVGRGKDGSPRASGPGAIAETEGASAGLTFRPVLCYAPPFSPRADHPSAGPLPACAAPYQLTAANLRVTPALNRIDGFSMASTIAPDPEFAPYASTPAGAASTDATVLWPATTAAGSGRYVLGPAALTRVQIASAHVSPINGQWVVEITLTRSGSVRFNSLAAQQFHALIGVTWNGTVISAPITQPTLSSFAPFGGRVEISGNFSEARADAIAASLSGRNNPMSRLNRPMAGVADLP